MIREQTASNYDFTGYVTGIGPADLAEHMRLHAELGLGMRCASASRPL
jgi:hypothetical protein